MSVNRAVLLTLLSTFLVGAEPGVSLAEYDQGMEDTYVALLVSEAGDQGYGGLLAVAEVLRNRGWRTAGFSGLHRKELHDFVSRQPRRVFRDARRAIAEARRGSDTVKGATHFDNVGAFGRPRWASGMRQVAEVGSHVFWRER